MTNKLALYLYFYLYLYLYLYLYSYPNAISLILTPLLGTILFPC